MPVLQGAAFNTVNVSRNGLQITPSAAFNTALAAATKLSIGIWYHCATGELFDQDGIFGWGRRAANEGGLSMGQGWNFGSTGGIWVEYSASGGLDMGSSAYAEFRIADLLIENAWQHLTLSVDLDQADKNNVFTIRRDNVTYASTTVIGTPPANFAPMANSMIIEIGARSGFYGTNSNAGNNRAFREAHLTLGTAYSAAQSALWWNSGNGATPADTGITPDIYVAFAPNDATGTDEQQASMATAILGGATMFDGAGLGAPFEGVAETALAGVSAQSSEIVANILNVSGDLALAGVSAQTSQVVADLIKAQPATSNINNQNVGNLYRPAGANIYRPAPGRSILLPGDGSQ